MTVCPHPKELLPTLDTVFDNQPIVSEILTHPSSRNNLLADEKGAWKRGADSYLYKYLYNRSVTELIY